MSEELRVNPERLREAARFIAEKAQTIRDRVKGLDDTVGRGLLCGGWRGRTASVYDESWMEWKTGADDVVAGLESSALKLVEAANRYQAQDAHTADQIARNNSRMQ
ncbi:WXG100 family type VII secretion target [Nocardia panacis]|uniref:ESAT-6-like protein n=1 Tax=Nocardia panacis TaxID=2340916 RepID=A0A3A4KFB5_9NOCA|nr:WXG100 family type VII secretion target [Nocardia panacis]RJO77659.1 WXG100 family type VII secretion target [Nocardia panacis]